MSNRVSTNATLPVVVEQALQPIAAGLGPRVVEDSVVQLVRGGTVSVEPIAVAAGHIPLRIPGLAYDIDLELPKNNHFNPIQLAAGAQPPPPAPPPPSYLNQARNWAKSYFNRPPAPACLVPRANSAACLATAPTEPYLQPFRGTLAQPAMARVTNLTGWSWIDWALSKVIRIECTGLTCNAYGDSKLDGNVRLFGAKLPFLSLERLAPIKKAFRINMQVRTLIQESPIHPHTQSAPEPAFAARAYTFDLLSRLLGEVRATVNADPNAAPTLNNPIHLAGGSFLPQYANASLKFAPEGLRTRLGTAGDVKIAGHTVHVETVLPLAANLGLTPGAPMDVQFGTMPIKMQAQLGNKIWRHEGISTLTDAEAEDERFFDPEGDFEPNAVSQN